MARGLNKEKLKYIMLAEVSGRWRADLLEVALKEKGIDVIMVEEAVHHLTHVFSFAPVKIFVPRESKKIARDLLEALYSYHENPKEKSNMANKKKIEERMQELQAKKTEQRTRMIGLGIIVVVLLLLGFMFLNNGRSNEPELPIPTLPPVTE